MENYMNIIRLEKSHPEAEVVLQLGGIIACQSPEGVDQLVYHEAFEPNLMPRVLRDFILAHESGHLEEKHLERLEQTTSEQRELEADACAIRKNGKWSTLAGILLFPIVLADCFKAVGNHDMAAKLQAAWAVPEYRARVKQVVFW
jgi:hypothetical protein